MTDSTHEIEADIVYDGAMGPAALLSGHTMNFYLPDIMPARNFLPFGGLTLAAPIPHGASGSGRFWVVATDGEREHLLPQAAFHLYSGGTIVARGTIVSARDTSPA